jgi:hypothetical protein
MRIMVTTAYTISSDTIVDLPEGKTWDAVENVYAKWNEITLIFKDGTEKIYNMADASMDSVDWKYPDATVIRPCDAEGNADYDSPELELA